MSDKTTTPDEIEEEPLNAFVIMLSTIRDGEAVSEASEALTEALEAAKETGKNAEVTCKIVIKPMSANQVVIKAATKVSKLPKPEIAPAVFFLDEHCCLCTSDPNQRELPLREVSRTPVREAAAQ